VIQVRKSIDRGHFNYGWLDTYHTFSFADYRDPNHMGFRSLRVINEDRVQPGQGFGTHPHRDMEILTYVIEGALEHKDSMGNGSIIRPGDVQRMTAGTGVTHSEFNPSKEAIVHLLQIWILPERKGLEPSYEQKNYPAGEKRSRLRLVASRDGREGSVSIHQDVNVYAALLESSETLTYEMAAGRHAWLQIIRGSVKCSGTDLSAGDGAAISEEREIPLSALGTSEVLLFDLA
jgi:hypothetical protein